MDFMSPKVLVPAGLFTLFSTRVIPGSVAIHAALMIIVYWTIVKIGLIKTSLTKADLLVPAVLFALLTPGILLTIPKGNANAAVAVHTVVFILVYSLLRRVFPQYY